MSPSTLHRRPVQGLERVMLEVGDSQGPDVVIARIRGRISPGVLDRATLAIAGRRSLAATQPRHPMLLEPAPFHPEHNARFCCEPNAVRQ
jgi:hypothetical protein